MGININKKNLIISLFILISTSSVLLISFKKKANKYIRYLPYPFDFAFSIADDVDISSWEGDMALKNSLWDKYGFNLSRSTHIYGLKSETDWLLNFGLDEQGKPLNAFLNLPDKPNPFFHMLESYYKGEIGYIHMWSDYGSNNWLDKQTDYPNLYRQTPLFEKNKLVVKKEDEEKNNTFNFSRKNIKAFPGMKFYLTVNAEVKNFKMIIKDKKERTFEICFVKDIQKHSKTCTWVLSLPNKNQKTLKAFFFKEDSKEILTKSNNPIKYQWENMEVLINGPKESTVIIEEAQLSAFNRKLVQRQSKILNSFGVKFWTYSDHGGTDNGVNLFRHDRNDYDGVKFYKGNNWSFRDKLTDQLISNHPEGAVPWSDYFFQDILIDNGSKFFIFGNGPGANRSLYGPKELKDIIWAYKTPSNQKVYGVTPYFPGGWKEQDKGESYSITWNARFGKALEHIIEETKMLGSNNNKVIFGPLIQHLGYEGTEERLGMKPHSIKIKNAFNSETQKALSKLTSRFYGFHDFKKEDKRIWVADINRLLRYAQVMNQIENRITKRKNSFIIKSWEDFNTNEILPTNELETRDLSGLTLYTENPLDSRVFVDNKEIFSFTRNSKDNTGRESITIVDTGTKMIVCDEICPSDKKRIIFEDKNAPSGKNIIKVHGGERITIKPNGPVNNIEGQTHFSFWAKSNCFIKNEKGCSNLSVKYLLEDGRQFSADFGDFKSKRGWHLNYLTNKWQKYVFDFTHANFTKTDREAPRGILKEISIKSDRDVLLDSIAFSRDNPTPNKRKKLIVGGRISPHNDNIPVKLFIDDKKEFETFTNNHGYFFFENIPNGSILKLISSDRSCKGYYSGGNKFEIGANHIDLDFNISSNSKSCKNKENFTNKNLNSGINYFR